MCGFVGFYGGKISKSRDRSHSIIKQMCESIKHRGPDHFGHWLNSDVGLHFGHQRLSIVDLTTTGNQPMQSISKKYVIVFNGEIYNHLEIRKQLTDNGFNKWIGTSDTETLLAGFETYGIKKTLEFVHGMFAMAVFDRDSRELILIRDRLGEKPLYYGWQGHSDNRTFLFSSQIKAFKKYPEFVADIDNTSVAYYLNHSYIPTPRTIYKNIFKLEPGVILKLRLDNLKITKDIYWNAINNFSNAQEKKIYSSFEEVRFNYEKKLTRVIKNQMLADVKVGAFLSGGIDSSLIVSLMQKESMSKIKTYSIGFDDENFSEARFAKKTAKFLGTDHSEFYINSNNLNDLIYELPKYYDEPFADSSQIPSFIISKFARKDVKVVLTGDGADELFYGYNRYKLYNLLRRIYLFSPQKLFHLLSLYFDKKYINYLNSTAQKYGLSTLGDQLNKFINLMSSKSQFELYFNLISYNFPDKKIINKSVNTTALYTKFLYSFCSNKTEIPMIIDQSSYLPDDILVKVDRATMASSLESRLPYLDHDLVDYSWKIPNKFKFSNKFPKHILFKTLEKYLPKNYFFRKKRGFGVPMAQWLRGDLKELTFSYLSSESINKNGFFDATSVTNILNQHLSGKSNWQHLIWNILMFQLWYEKEINHI